MPNTMQVELVSVERPIWSGEATAVYARTPEGEIGVMAGHAPLLGALEPGWLVRIQQADGVEQRIAVHGGFLSVRHDGVSVLAEIAESSDEIDVARARAALERAGSGSDDDTVAARNRALSRLRAAGEQV
ncbi:F0F1 ATP synthase subunit epsilon [Jatrophihabitans telluris]|uniref:ATP synthase epsilon chain n=2 Tax=Jatrophihabitans telluris TaxID=2038343 RepID=A0ABY4R229_9ACTN|nr:F0F1 ATP synthase subunit epsilon [Jatrophihabitans telluris]UQX89870.1 F0F1 ATP synthase subunit epsilon [Jatrophihabitans telluris]